MRTITNTRPNSQPPDFARPLALRIIPPHKSGDQKQRDQEVALEAAMQSLVLDTKHPVALELAGTAERRSFIVRATSQIALDHVEALLRSQYAQVGVEPLRVYEDPFLLQSHEDVSAIELVAGASPYMPLKTWQDPKQKPQGETDPILGLLAALSKLPEGMRAVTQIALVPAPPDWSKPYLRKSIEDALEPEKRKSQVDMANARDSMQATNWAVSKSPWESLSTPVILILAVFVGIFALAQHWIPAWVGEAFRKLVTGQDPHLGGGQIFQIVASVVGILLLCLLIFIGLERVRLLFQGEMYDTKLVSEKTSRMAYRVRIRLYVIGPANRAISQREGEVYREGYSESRAGLWQKMQFEREHNEFRQEVLLRLIAAYRQFHIASGAYFVPKPLSTAMARRLISAEIQRPGHGWHQELIKSRHLISVDALAALWHMPSSSALPELALVEHRRSRTLLMSPELARLSEGYPPVGYSEHGGYRLPFSLNPQFFTMHTLIGGKSGEGKSTFMEHIARDAMSHGGLVLIDPHGDLCENVLRAVPEHRADDVVLIDLSDATASTGINPLDVTLGRNRDKAISDLLKTLSRIWEEAWGPRMENAFEMALRTLFEANRMLVAQDAQEGPHQQYTILDVLPVLTNENFCHAILQQIQDDYLHRWWREYYEPMTLMQQRDVVIPVLSKVAKFEGVIARRILGQSVSTVNFTQLIAERKIILLKLAKGVVGADVAAIVGATLLGLIQLTLEEQGSKSLEERVRLPIIIDEFQTIAGADYGALAELRKYGATFFLATQSLEYLQKLDEVLLPLVLANIKQLVIFHMSAQDAETLCEEMGVEQEDITNLDMYTCYVKLLAETRRQPIFSLKVSPPPQGTGLMAESIRTRCRVRYTCSVDVIDERLREAMVRSLRLAPPPTPKGKKKRNAVHTGSIDSLNAVIQLPAANRSNNSSRSMPEPEENFTEDLAPSTPPSLPEAGTEQPARARGRRGRRGGKKTKSAAARGGTTALAFSDDFDDGAMDNAANLDAPSERSDR